MAESEESMEGQAVLGSQPTAVGSGHAQSSSFVAAAVLGQMRARMSQVSGRLRASQLERSRQEREALEREIQEQHRIEERREAEVRRQEEREQLQRQRDEAVRKWGEVCLQAQQERQARRREEQERSRAERDRTNLNRAELRRKEQESLTGRSDLGKAVQDQDALLEQQDRHPGEAVLPVDEQRGRESQHRPQDLTLPRNPWMEENPMSAEERSRRLKAAQERLTMQRRRERGWELERPGQQAEVAGDQVEDGQHQAMSLEWHLDPHTYLVEKAVQREDERQSEEIRQWFQMYRQRQGDEAHRQTELASSRRSQRQGGNVTMQEPLSTASHRYELQLPDRDEPLQWEVDHHTYLGGNLPHRIGERDFQDNDEERLEERLEERQEKWQEKRQEERQKGHIQEQRRQRKRPQASRQQQQRRQRERRQQKRREREEEGSHVPEPQSEEVMRWLEMHRQRQEKESRRREELAAQSSQQRQKSRSTRTEAESVTSPRRRRPFRQSTAPVSSDLPSHRDWTSPEMITAQREALAELIGAADTAFREKQEATARRSWCDPIPLDRKVETVQSFLKAFHDESTMEIETCSVCYLKKRPRDLDQVDWREAIPNNARSIMTSVFACKRCFPEADGEAEVSICATCRTAFDRGRVPEACMGSTMLIGCEHRYPQELSDLTPLEEKLISLNSAYGFITKFNIQKGQVTGPTYRKHVVGHITVFPNDVETLTNTILPHSLLATLDQVHVIWTGRDRPTPLDVSKLLTVRPGVLRAALQWLRLNNPLYAEIGVNSAEMDSWAFEGNSGVPVLAYSRMVREEETVEELVRTGQIVPPGDRGQASISEGPSVEDVARRLSEKANDEAALKSADSRPVEQSLEEAIADETVERVFEVHSSAMFPIDDEASFAEGDKLEFVSMALQAERNFDDDFDEQAGALEPSIRVFGSSERPFIRVSRGRNFAEALAVDYFPKTFPKCFPFGGGGPRVQERNPEGGPVNPLVRDMTLESWAKVVLRRHGGRFAQHPAFSFLVFNMLLRYRNRRISRGRLLRSAFRRVEGIQRKLTAERVQEAQEEMLRTGKTTDVDVLALMKELSLYGNRHPLSNESRLSMRKKIWSVIVAFGLTAIWFTINPNDINNPVKLKLAAHRDRDKPAARAFIRALSTSLQVTTLSVHDPLSSTIFFFREISIFFEQYVRVGKPSIYGTVSHYYATIETNDRGALHLHGLLWLDGNLALGDLVRDMANPDETEYRCKVKSFVDDVFTESLKESLAKEAIASGRKTTVIEPKLVEDATWLGAEFEREASFNAFRCQVHHHSATCMKYSIKEVLMNGVSRCRTQLCRFRAPWRLVAETGFTGDGLLEVRRDHQMVNRYNQSMAIGLRHNHDLSMILTRKKGLALLYYICNYATKLNAPMWKRLAHAAELLHLSRQQTRQLDDPDAPETVGEETTSFLLRVANRIFTSRELSQPEVLGYLLDFGTDFTNVCAWTWVHLNSLYWACAREWPGLRELLSAELGYEPRPENLYFQSDGFRLPYVEAYKHRGPVLQALCFYEYLAFVIIKKEQQRQRGLVIPFPHTATVCAGWIQCLRPAAKAAVPIFDGRITDEYHSQDENFVKRNAVLHLALFVPWEQFRDEGLSEADDIPRIWKSFEHDLSDRIRSHVRNIALLRVSAEDARVDRRLQNMDEDFADVVDPQAFGDQVEDESLMSSQNITSMGPKDYHEAFLSIVTKAQEGEIKGMPVSLGLESLSAQARTASAEDGDDAAAQRGRHFYRQLQEIQRSPLRGVGLLGREEIEAVLKIQKKANDNITASILGRDRNERPVQIEERAGETAFVGNFAETIEAGRMSLEIGPYTSHADIAMALSRKWTLNKLQSMAVLLPAVFLDQRDARLQEEEGRQHLQYVGGEGGTGKSRIIHAIKDMFLLKDSLHTLLLTGASGNAAALIGGVTLHSACNLGFEGKYEASRSVSEEEKLRWKNVALLVVDEISQVGGLTLASVDNRLRLYRDDAHRPFGGVPIVIFFGDFYQFDPVRQTSLLLPEPKDPGRQRPETLAKHLAAHKLFLQFTTVVILREQVRAARCAQLRGFLQRLRDGQQTESDFESLCRRLYNQGTQPSFADGLRAVTPLNQDRWDLNMAAVVQWARAQGKHISIFIAKHDVVMGQRLSTEDLYNALRYGDDSHLPTPGLFFYAQGMPVVVTRNQLPGLKLVNGAPFEAADIIPDLTYGTIALASDVTLHLGPPAAILLQSDETAGLETPGLPKGTILIRSKAVAIPESMRGNESRMRGKPGFKHVTHRTGPLCTPAFAMTDQKSQGKQFSKVLLNLKGVRGSSIATRPSFMSLYVQLSRAESWSGIYLFRKPARGDFIEPKNVLDREMRDAVLKLEKLGDQTTRDFERDHRHESWFQDWDAIPDSTPTSEVVEEDDSLVWNRHDHDFG